MRPEGTPNDGRLAAITFATGIDSRSKTILTVRDAAASYIVAVIFGCATRVRLKQLISEPSVELYLKS
jgi:hypothetical protein